MACARCGCGVYHSEDIVTLNKMWHKCCFSCCKCNEKLDKCSAKIFQGEVFCERCYKCILEESEFSSSSCKRPCRVVSSPSCCCVKADDTCKPCKVYDFCFPSEKISSVRQVQSCICLPSNKRRCFPFPIPREVANYYNRNNMKRKPCMNSPNCCPKPPCIRLRTLSPKCCRLPPMPRCRSPCASKCSPKPCQPPKCPIRCRSRTPPCRCGRCCPKPSCPPCRCCCESNPCCCPVVRPKPCCPPPSCSPKICYDPCPPRNCFQPKSCPPKSCCPQQICFSPCLPKDGCSPCRPRDCCSPCPPIRCPSPRRKNTCDPCSRPRTSCNCACAPREGIRENCTCRCAEPCNPPKYCLCGNKNPCNCKMNKIRALCTACCLRCGGKVYAAEKITVTNGAYHTCCFSCYCCRKLLDLKSVYEHCNEIYCKRCYNNYFGIQYYGYGSSQHCC